MGLTTNSVRFLLRACEQGAVFRRTLMLGRHQLITYPGSLREFTSGAIPCGSAWPGPRTKSRGRPVPHA